MRMPKRKFKNGEIVIADKKLKLVVVGAILRIKGWRYQLAFPKKDGTPNKTKNHLFFFEDKLIKSK